MICWPGREKSMGFAAEILSCGMVFVRYRYGKMSTNLSESHVKPDPEINPTGKPTRTVASSTGKSSRDTTSATGKSVRTEAAASRKPPRGGALSAGLPDRRDASSAGKSIRADAVFAGKSTRADALSAERPEKIPEIPLAEPKHLIPDSEKYAGMAIQLFVNGFTALFVLASLFDVLYAGDQMLVLAGSRLVFVGLVWLVLYVVDEKGPLRYLPVHAALLVTVMHAFTAWILAPEIPVNLYWSVAAFAVLVAPLAVNWAQHQSLWQWIAGLAVTLITIYAVPAMELGAFLLQGGGFYLASLTAAVLLPAGWIPLQKRLAKQRSTPVIRVEQPDETDDTLPVMKSGRGSDETDSVPQAYRHSTSDDVTPGRAPDTIDASFPDSPSDSAPEKPADVPAESDRSAGDDTAPTSPSKPRKFRHTAFADLFNQGGGAEPLTTGPQSLTDALHSVLGSMQDLAASREVTLELIQPETNIWVTANLQGLHRALTGIVETLLRSTRETRFQVILEVGNPYVDVHFAISRTGLSSGDPQSVFAILDVLSRKLEPYTASISTAMFTAATLLSRMEGSLLHTRTGTEVEYARVRLQFNKETDA